MLYLVVPARTNSKRTTTYQYKTCKIFSRAEVAVLKDELLESGISDALSRDSKFALELQPAGFRILAARKKGRNLSHRYSKVSKHQHLNERVNHPAVCIGSQLKLVRLMKDIPTWG